MPVESLYTPHLIAASKDNRYVGEIDDEDVLVKEGSNPLCGDTIKWFVKVNPDGTLNITFKTSGCLISRASAAFLASLMQGKNEAQLKVYSEMLKKITTKNTDTPTPDQLNNAPWLSLAQIRDYPTRKKCVYLAWNTLASLLDTMKI